MSGVELPVRSGVRGSTAGIIPRLEGFSDEQLARAFTHAREVTKAQARNFYYGLRLLPEPRRSAVFAIYAWMRRADDCADEGASVEFRRANLERLGEQTRRALSGDHATLVSDWLWPALVATVRSYHLDEQLIIDTLAGLAGDLGPVACRDDAELETYCYRVASTVGLLCVGVWGLRDGLDEPVLDTVHHLAVRRGHAFQLTNILRDFAQDYDQGRVYLPSDSFERAGLSPDQLRRWSDGPRCARFVQGWAQRARDWYLESAPLDALIAPDCRSTLWAMTRIYWGILERINASPARVVASQRVGLSPVQKSAIALRAAIMNRWGG